MKQLYLTLVVLILVLTLAACGSNDQQATQATTQPTAQVTQPTQPPAQATSAHTASVTQPTASELIKLVQISPADGKVTAATLTPQSPGKVGVGFDVTIKNPTQSRIKHVSYEILSTVLQVSAISIANIDFHANGYTGMDDPIASDGAVSRQVNWATLDDNSAWDATSGVFDANLSA